MALPKEKVGEKEIEINIYDKDYFIAFTSIDYLLTGKYKELYNFELLL